LEAKLYSLKIAPVLGNSLAVRFITKLFFLTFKVKNIKVVIPAAGFGKRMGALTNSTNKALMKVGQESLIIHSLKNFRAMGLSDIIVVVGYKRNEVIKEIGSLANCIYNPFFHVSGILVSLWMAQKFLKGKKFIFSTSDHFFHKDVLKALLKQPEELRVLVQKKKLYSKEDAKVRIKNSKVIQMSKQIPPEQSNGEFAGMAYFGARASRYFFEELEDFFENGRLDSYVMDAIMEISKKKKIPIDCTICKENQRIEIDSVSDLVKARRLRLFGKYDKR
jgi:choline kinase